MTVLVLGPTGRLGPHVVSALVRRGEPVRALVRDVERARTLLPQQVTLVAGEFADGELIRRQLSQVDSVLVLTPHGPDMAGTQNALVDLSAAVGTRVVKVSGTSAGIRPDGPDACRQHHETEQHLAESDVPYVIVRPNGFMQSLLPAMSVTVREKGIIANPLGTSGISLVDCADLGEALSVVLTDRTHDGRRYVLTGPAAPTYREIAATISEEVGAPVTVVDVSPEQAGQAAAARGLSAWEAGHLVEMLELFRSGASEYVTDDIERLTGRVPRSVADFVCANRAMFLTT